MPLRSSFPFSYLSHSHKFFGGLFGNINSNNTSKKCKNIDKSRFALKENAEGFFRESVRLAVESESDNKKWKYAVLFIVQATELILKYALREENEILVYEKIDEPNNKKTVSLKTAFDRLQRFNKFTFEETDKKNIFQAIEIRNEIVHFFCDDNTDFKVIYAQQLGFFIHCYNRFYGGNISDLIEKDLWKKILSIKEYLNEIEAQFKKFVEQSDSDSEFWECPSCFNDSLDNGESCRICGHRDTVIECDLCGKLLLESRIGDDYMQMENGKIICEHCIWESNKADYDRR